MRGNDIARFQRLQRNGALEVVRSCLEVVAQKKGAKRLTRGVEKYTGFCLQVVNFTVVFDGFCGLVTQAGKCG